MGEARDSTSGMPPQYSNNFSAEALEAVEGALSFISLWEDLEEVGVALDNSSEVLVARVCSPSH